MVLGQMTWWERTVFVAVAIGGVVLTLAVGQERILSAVLVGLAVLGGLELAYRDDLTTAARRGRLLIWTAFMLMTFAHLAEL
jgi:hypothetical protein